MNEKWKERIELDWKWSIRRYNEIDFYWWYGGKVGEKGGLRKDEGDDLRYEDGFSDSKRRERWWWIRY